MRRSPPELGRVPRWRDCECDPTRPRTGRIRLHASRIYVILLESLADPEQATREWLNAKREGIANVGVREEFYRSPNAQR